MPQRIPAGPVPVAGCGDAGAPDTGSALIEVCFARKTIPGMEQNQTLEEPVPVVTDLARTHTHTEDSSLRFKDAAHCHRCHWHNWDDWGHRGDGPGGVPRSRWHGDGLCCQGHGNNLCSGGSGTGSWCLQHDGLALEALESLDAQPGQLLVFLVSVVSLSADLWACWRRRQN